MHQTVSSLSNQTIATEDYTRQCQLEEEMRGLGAERYLAEVAKAQAEGRESTTSYGVSLIKGCLEPMSKAIADWIETAMTGRAKRAAGTASLVDGLPHEVVAFLTLRTVFDGITRQHMVQNVIISISHEIELEQQIRYLEKIDEERYEVTAKHVSKSSNRRYRSTVYKHALGKSEHGEWVSWTQEQKRLLGEKLLHLVIDVTGLVEIVKKDYAVKRKANIFTTAYILSPTQKCMEWINDRNSKISLLSPVFLPTIIKPKPWTGAWGGGYYTFANRRLSLVKTRNKQYLDDLDSHLQCGGADEVLDAINAMQNTGWRVNTKVLDVLTQVWESSGGSEVAGLPPRDPVSLPRCPICGVDIEGSAKARHKHECLEADQEAKAQWKSQAAQVRERNIKLLSQRIQVARMLWLAEKYRDERAFYFPYQLDFRGRVYTMTSHLTPQGTDASKGLLQFAQGKPLGTDTAVTWLAIHGANTWGNDKVSFEERRQWVEDNTDRILAVAADPLGERWWQDADSPFCFLAFCFEWAGYKAQGLTYVSHLPIAMDGSCNGLQIFSLMLRDEIGGKATNLLPCERPQDIYGIVATKVTEKLKGLVSTGQDVFSKSTTNDDGSPKLLYNEAEQAHAWLELGLDRKATKRQVMVLPYGGTQQSCREYTEEYLRGRIDKGAKWSLPIFASSLFLSKLIWDAIGETVVAARDAMSFLQKVASIVSSEGMPVIWTSPTGFPIRQEYRDTASRRVSTKLGDRILKLSLTEEQDTISTRRQQSGVSPNYVHSLDASALQRTVCRAMKAGITNFAMIHDSYGTHAADTALLARILREVFVGMFGGEHNVLSTFLNEARVWLPESKATELPELPPTGTLEVSKVLEAVFFFA